MTMPDVPLLSMLKSRMSWLEARQNVLSQNVANADTPGYAARDLKPMDFESLVKGASGSAFNTQLSTTDARHIAIAPSQARTWRCGPRSGPPRPRCRRRRRPWSTRARTP